MYDIKRQMKRNVIFMYWFRFSLTYSTYSLPDRMMELRTTRKETQGIQLAVTKQYFTFTYRSCDSGLVTMGNKLGSFHYELKLDNTESHIRNQLRTLEHKQTPDLLNCGEFRYKLLMDCFVCKTT